MRGRRERDALLQFDRLMMAHQTSEARAALAAELQPVINLIAGALVPFKDAKKAVSILSAVVLRLLADVAKVDPARASMLRDTLVLVLNAFDPAGGTPDEPAAEPAGPDSPVP